jgi:aerobic carbon-monoxide dehydrogenase medium subunit
MIGFEWAEPASLPEALALLSDGDPSVRPIAGGTALMLMMKAGIFQPTKLVSLHRVGPELSGTKENADGSLEIGAMTTLTELQHAPTIAKSFPVVRRALVRLSNPRVRNVARVGGALAHGDPHMDLPPLLAMLGARAVIRGTNGTREVAVEDLYTGYYETVLQADELISKVIVPPLSGRKAAYAKVTARAVEDWPALGVALSLATEGDTIGQAKIVISAATEKVLRLPETEKALTGKRADAETLKSAGDIAAGEASLLSDAQGSAAYKRELLRVYIGRAVRQALFNSQH